MVIKMKDLIQFHIDGDKNKYMFKIQPPSKAIIKQYPRVNTKDERDKVINKVIDVQKKIFLGERLPEYEEEMLRNLEKIGILLKDILGKKCVKDLKELLEKNY